MSTGRLTLACLFVVLTALLVGACGGDDDDDAAAPKELTADIPSPFADGARQASGTYVGPAGPGKDPYVGLVVRGDKVAAYVCDGEKVSDWFGGKVSDGRFDLRSKEDTQLVGEVARDRVRGTVTLPNSPTLSYTAEPASEGKTGLFRDDETIADDGVLGWVVLETGIRGNTRNRQGNIVLPLSVKVTAQGASETSTTTGTTTGTEDEPGERQSCAELNDRWLTLEEQLQFLRKQRRTPRVLEDIRRLEAEQELWEELFTNSRCIGRIDDRS